MIEKYCSNIQGQIGFNLPLFNFEGPDWNLMEKEREHLSESWGCSSAGRAPALQAGGQRFDPAYLHQFWLNCIFSSCAYTKYSAASEESNLFQNTFGEYDFESFELNEVKGFERNQKNRNYGLVAQVVRAHA